MSGLEGEGILKSGEDAVDEAGPKPQQEQAAPMQGIPIRTVGG